MRLVGQLAVAAARPDHQGEHQGGDARADVHHVAAGKIVCPDYLGDPAAAPHHVRQRGIDEQHPEHDEGDEAAKPHPLDDAARDDRHRDEREHALEEGPYVLGNVAVELVEPHSRQK